jgi:hypothetical protein
VSRFIRIVCLLLPVFVPIGAFAADLEFTGSLQQVAPESILIRLADGKRIDAQLPKAGALAAEAIRAQYKLADEVRITCKPMGDRCLTLKSLKYLRPPTPKEQALVLGTPIPASSSDPGLEHVRQVNLDRAANMPNFVADETAKRYTGFVNSTDWGYVDTVESEITVKGIDVDRLHMRRNGQPLKKPVPVASTGFGAELKPLFDPECPTTIDFAGRQEVRGKQVRVYRFSSPPDGCFGFLSLAAGPRHNAARTGRVLVDSDGNVIQYEEEAVGPFPAGFHFDQRNEVVSWDRVAIGDASFWLPVAADFIWRYPSGEQQRTTIEYKNHRHFEAATSLTFH